jgi:hypothetical protein
VAVTGNAGTAQLIVPRTAERTRCANGMPMPSMNPNLPACGRIDVHEPNCACRVDDTWPSGAPAIAPFALVHSGKPANAP